MAMPQSTLLTCSILRAQAKKMKVTMVQQALEPISNRPLEKLVPKVTFRFLFGDFIRPGWALSPKLQPQAG
jgi:hypothetical protein